MKFLHTAAVLYGIDITTAAKAYEARTGTAPSDATHWDWMVQHSVALGRFQSTSEVYGPITVLYHTAKAQSLFEGSEVARPFDPAIPEDASRVLSEAFELLGLDDVAGPAGDPKWLLILNAQDAQIWEV